MPSKRVGHKKPKGRYQIVLVPRDEMKPTRSFRINRFGMFVFSIVLFLVIGTAVVLLLNYTPVGIWVPVKNYELENKYGKQLVMFQEKLNQITKDMILLQSYNAKLRKVLGPSISGNDSVAASEPLKHSDLELSTENFKTDEALTVSDEMDLIMNPRTLSSFSTVSTATSDAFRASLPLLFPTQGYITRGFEPAKRHFGIDIAGKVGTIVTAAAEGHILFSGWTYDAGYMVIISHGGGYFTFYKHNQTLLKIANTFVKRGEPIARLGNSGTTSYGPHLHFEVWKDGVPRDPNEYVLTTHL